MTLKSLSSLCCIAVFHLNSYAQVSTEQFESETNNSTNFTDNGVTFDIISQVNNYSIQTGYPATGWNGTNSDNVYIDNTGRGNQRNGTSFSIKTTSNLFKAKRFWIYASAANTQLDVNGSITITGKLAGVVKYSAIKTTGFNTTIATANGFTSIDLSTLDGQDFSNIIIDELQVTAGGEFQYLSFDAFTWDKQAATILSTKNAKISTAMAAYPNPSFGPITVKNVPSDTLEVFDVTGKRVHSSVVNQRTAVADLSELNPGMYLLKSGTEVIKIIKN